MGGTKNNARLGDPDSARSLVLLKVTERGNEEDISDEPRVGIGEKTS